MELLLLLGIAGAIMVLFHRYLIRDRRRQARRFHPSNPNPWRLVPAANSGWFIVALVLVGVLIVLVVFV